MGKDRSRRRAPQGVLIIRPTNGLSFANGRIKDAAVMHSGRNDQPDGGERAFFGRRKGKKLRPRQAGLFETLLPRLALDLTNPPPADLRTLFDARRRGPLEIGFGGGEHFVARSRAQSAHWLYRRRAVRERNGEGSDRDRSAGLDAMSGCIMATRRNCSHGCRRHRSRASTCSIPIRGRSAGTGSAASCRTRASQRSRAFSNPAANSASPATFPITRHGRWCGFCARAISSGRPSAPTIGACRGRDFDSTRYELKAKREGRQTCYLTFPQALRSQT